MAFSKDLKHLEDALINPPSGYPKGFTKVSRRSLGELLHHFKRLDEAVRQRHAEELAEKEGI